MKRAMQTLAVLAMSIGTLLANGCGTPAAHTPPVELHVLAAASLSDAMKELQTLYQAKHQDVRLVQVFGSSGMLQQQIEQGAPADLFLSAGAQQMQALLAEHLIDPKKEANLLRNDLVLVVPKDAAVVKVHALTDLAKPDLQKVSIGQPDAVPAGHYAKQALTRSGLWEQVQQKLVYAKDVRQVLSYVETESVEAGLVYKTDALSSQQVEIAATIDPQAHDPIVYPFGVVQNSPHAQQAQEFYDWLGSPEASAVFAKYGFGTADAGVTSP